MPRPAKDTVRKSVPLKQETVQKIAAQIEQDKETAFIDMDEGRFLASIIELIMSHKFLQLVNDSSPKEAPFISKLKRLLDSEGLQQLAAIAEQLQQEDIIFLLDDVIAYGLPRLIEDLQKEYRIDLSKSNSSSAPAAPKESTKRKTRTGQSPSSTTSKASTKPLEVVAVVKKPRS
jgi:hypothetical protein